MTQITIGIDISKDSLDMAIHLLDRVLQFTNSYEGIRAMMRKIKSLQQLNIVVFEPTARFHKNLEQALRQEQISALPR